MTNPTMKKLRVAELKERIWSECLEPEINSQKKKKKEPLKLTKVYQKVVELEAEMGTLKVQSIFLMLLHMANERKLTLENDQEDIKILFDSRD